MVSPFEILEVCPSETLITFHHNLYIADSKESLVLVDGSKNKEAITFHFKLIHFSSQDNIFSISSEALIIKSISLFEN
jgi:hypothetical protein